MVISKLYRKWFYAILGRKYRMRISEENPLQICLLLGTETVPEWFAHALKVTLANSEVELSLVILVKTAEESENIDLITDIRRKKSWTVVSALQKLSNMISRTPTYSTSRNIEELSGIDSSTICQTSVEQSGEYGYKFPEKTIATVTEQADVAVHFGIGILRGEILNTPPLGVIGFHHGDLRTYRGGPPGLWEFVHNESKTGVTVQRFNETLDGGEILAFKSIPIEDARSWREVRRRQCTASEKLLAEALENLVDPEFTAETPKTLGPVYSPSQRDWRTTVRYLQRELIGRMRLQNMK